MARAIEKGATYLDKLCHKLYDEPKGREKKTDYVCRLCGGPLETYYCEERLYLVKCADCGTLALVKTVNPEASASVTLARPTLTPPNEWVSVEERSPENNAQVLMWSAKWNIAEAGSYYNERFWVYSEIGDAYIADDITHWMPLPAPPGKDNNVPAKAPNEPLTLERLREMDGQPVYIVFLPDVTGEKLQFWALVDVDAFGDVNLTNNLGGSSPYEEVMGNIEAIYRRPPEGEEDT